MLIFPRRPYSDIHQEQSSYLEKVMPAIQGGSDIPHLLRKWQNMTARSAPRGALLAKQTVGKKTNPNQFRPAK